jgi:hypothetical protein
VGATTFAGQPSYGTDVEPASAFLNSTWSGAYADGSLGTGTLRDDVGGWTGYAPLACFGVSCDIADPLATSIPTTAPTASVTASPFESFAGETAFPTEDVGGATSTPGSATPPPTSTNGPSDGGSSTLLAGAICAAFAALGVVAAASQRRAVQG